MPHILVVADAEATGGEETVTLRERVNLSDLESRHFAAQLLERLNWAVGDAYQAELALVSRCHLPHETD